MGSNWARSPCRLAHNGLDMNIESTPSPSVQEPQRKRPLSVTLVLLGVLTLAGFNLLRFVASLQQWIFLDSLPTVHPVYLAVTGFLWAITGLVLVRGLWLGKQWSVRGTQAWVLLYSLYFWLDRWLVASNGSGYNWPFAVVMNCIFVVLVFWILSNRKAKAFFGAMHD